MKKEKYKQASVKKQQVYHPQKQLSISSQKSLDHKIKQPVYHREKQLSVYNKIKNYLEKFSESEKNNLLTEIRFIESKKTYYTNKYYETKYFTNIYTGDAGCADCVAAFKKYKITNQTEWERWESTNESYVDPYIMEIMRNCSKKFFDVKSLCNKDDLIPEPPSPDSPDALEKLIVSLGSSQGRWVAIKGVFSEKILKYLKNNLNSALDKAKEEGIQLLKSLYKLINTEFLTEKDIQILLCDTGVGLLNIAFSLLGLGFAFGPLKDVIGHFKPSVPEPSTVSSEAPKGVDQHDVDLIIIAINDAILASQNFLSEYSDLKYADKVLCPTPSGCVKDPINGLCDESKTNNKTLDCMKKETYPKMRIYDPSIELNSLDIGSADKKRTQLFNYFTGATSAIQKLVKNPDHDYLAKIEDYSKFSLKAAMTLYPTYLLLISNSIAYYQELANIDTQFNNPWKSFYIGDFYRDPDQSQQMGVLGFMQKSALSSYEYIRRMFIIYSKTIDFTITHNVNLNSFITDNSANGKDGNIDSVLEDLWYETIRKKYIEVNPYYSQYGKKTNINLFQNFSKEEFFDDFTKQYYMTKYLIYFNERLGFPFRDIMVYRKMAGFKDDFTSDDLFLGILYDIYYENGFNKFYPKTKEEVSNYSIYNDVFYKFAWDIAFPKQFIVADRMHTYDDTTGGYPFGFEFPSYVESKKIYKDYEFNNDPSIESTNYTNNYCTPLLPVTPGSSFDYSQVLNDIPGNSVNYTESLYCEDPNADSVKSCLKAGAIPGTDNNRIAFCYDSKTKLPSKITNTKPQVWNQPAKPPSGYIKNWYLKNLTQNNRLSLHINDIYTYNGLELSHTEWDQTTMVFYLEGNVNKFMVVFGKNEEILGGKLGDFYFDSPVIPKLESDANIPDIPLYGTDPKVRIFNGRKELCSFEYKIHSDNTLVDSGYSGAEREKSDWKTFPSGTTLTLSARITGFFKDYDWQTIAVENNTKKGYLYEFYQNCTCDIPSWLNGDGRLCFDLKKTDQNPYINPVIYNLRYPNIPDTYYNLPTWPSSGYRIWDLFSDDNNIHYQLVYVGDGSKNVFFNNVNLGQRIGIKSITTIHQNRTYVLMDGTTIKLVFGPNEIIIKGNISANGKVTNFKGFVKYYDDQ